MPSKKSQIVALFRTREEAESSIADAAAVPSADRWNDFGYRLLADIGLRGQDGKLAWFPGRFAVQGEKDFKKFVASVLGDKQGGQPVGTIFNTVPGVPVSDVRPAFASLLIETKYYSLARRTVGAERAQSLLEELHDLALLAEAQDEVPGWPDFFESEVYQLAMVRSSESYFASRRGAWILAGRLTSGTDARSPFQAHLKGVGPKPTLNFTFRGHNALRGRIAVLIGKNGCGKTSCLAKLARGLVDLKSRLATIENRPEVNQVLAFAHSASLHHFQPSARSQGSARVRTFSLDPHTSRRPRREESDTRLLVDIARSHDDEGLPSLRYLKAILEEEFPALKVYVPVKADATASYSIKDGEGYRPLDAWMLGGEQRQLEAAGELDHTRGLIYLDEAHEPRGPSLGQLAFVRFVLTALANAGAASVFVIDEPENFLHPNLISRFMRVLHKVLTDTHSIAILATHSPFVVREVQSSQVHILRPTDDGTIDVGTPLLQTLGANVASVSNEVFGDDMPEHLYEDLLTSAQTANLTFEQALERFAGELSTEALMLLRSKIESSQ